MYVADTLSRDYLPFESSADEQELAEDINVLVHSLLSDYPASIKKMEQLQEETAQDPELSQLMLCNVMGSRRTIIHPTACNTTRSLRTRCTSSMACCSLTASSLHCRQSYILQLIHEGHLGTEKCKTMARRTTYWPNMSRDIENFVAKCSVCNNFRRQQTAQPLLPHPVPERPWQKVGVDI